MYFVAMTNNLSSKISVIEQYVRCPETGGSLEYRTDHFYCQASDRKYPFSQESIVELLPPGPTSFSFDRRSAYHENIYKTLFSTKLAEANPEKSWAPPELVPEKWRTTKLNHVQFIRRLIEETTNQRETYCDFTGASGYYTFEMAKHFKWVFHCDISSESMLYAKQRADKEGLQNIIFIRADYFRPPFDGTLDLIYCGDTLIFSPSHEGLLLKGMYKSLKPGGYALFDFHNWWHNPIRRMGLMSNNFGECYSYNKAETLDFVTHHFPEHRHLGYYQEFRSGHRPAWMPGIFPNTRHMYAARKT